MSFRWHRRRLTLLLISVASILAPLPGGRSATLAQGTPAFVGWVRALESDETGVPDPVGLAFSRRASAFYVVAGRGRDLSTAADTELITLTPFGEQADLARIVVEGARSDQHSL